MIKFVISIIFIDIITVKHIQEHLINLTDDERIELIKMASDSIYESDNKKMNRVLAFYKTSYYNKLDAKQDAG